jgi:hypothetical protein
LPRKLERDSLRVVPLAPPRLPEPARQGEYGTNCPACDRAADSAHTHVFFFARPAGFTQLRGTCLALWDDLLPAVPDGQRDADAAEVARLLAASHDGEAHVNPSS